MSVAGGKKFANIWKSDPAMTMFFTPDSIKNHPLARTTVFEDLRNARDAAVESARRQFSADTVDEDACEDGVDAFGLDDDAPQVQKQTRPQKRQRLIGKVLPKVIEVHYVRPGGCAWLFQALVGSKRSGLAIEATVANFQKLFEFVQEDFAKELSKLAASDSKECGCSDHFRSDHPNVSFDPRRNKWLAKTVKIGTPNTTRPGAISHSVRRIPAGVENAEAIAMLFASGETELFKERLAALGLNKGRSRKRPLDLSRPLESVGHSPDHS